MSESGKSILIIEDDEITVEFYKGAFTSFDVDIDVVTTYKDAICQMKKKEYDLYIIDIVLAGGGKGIDVIGKGGATPDKCIIVSGSMEEKVVSVLINFFKIPRAQIMIKPVDMSILLQMANEIVFHTKESAAFVPESEYAREMEEKIDYLESKMRYSSDAFDHEDGHEEESIKSLVFKLFSKFDLRHYTLTFGFIALFWGATSTFIDWKAYEQHLVYGQQIEIYAEKRFSRFRKGDEITKRTYIEHIDIMDESEMILRFYPDGFVSVLITSEEDTYEPVHYWLNGSDFFNDADHKKYKGFFDILASKFKSSKTVYFKKEE